jgi:hypothetical protein
MKITGHLEKMVTELKDVVQYQLPLDNQLVLMNPLIGQPIKLTFEKQIHCVVCGKLTSKSFGQGFCYTCFSTAPQAEECVLHPEKCQAHLGVSRDPEYAATHCLIDHFVYLAVSSGLKVGVTRHTQIPTRWIDQGAVEAIKLARVPNRHMAGLIEVLLMKYYSDKTNWQQMLKNEQPDFIDLLAEKQAATKHLNATLKRFVSDDDSITRIQYPVLHYPALAVTLNLDNTGVVSGTLMGIKGQYLMFDNDTVLNIRRFSGYLVTLEY